MWLVVVHFTCPMISSIPHYCTEPLFHHLSQFVLKMEHFRYVQVDNHMWKYGQERFWGCFFFCLTSLESKYQSNLITKRVQMIFLAWSGYFEYVPYLSHGTMLIFLNNVNVSIWLLSTSTGLPNCGTQSSKSPAWNFANHFWHVQSITTHSPYTAKIFFVFQLHFYLSWNNKT